MEVTLWYIIIIIGGLLIGMALGSRGVERLPVTPALLYRIAGIVLGPMALGLIRVDPLADHQPLLCADQARALLRG